MGMRQADTTISKVATVVRAMAPKDITTDEIVTLLDDLFNERQIRQSVINYLGRQRRHRRRPVIAYDHTTRTVSWVGPTGKKTTQPTLPDPTLPIDVATPAGPTSEDVILELSERRDREDYYPTADPDYYPEHAEPREDGTWEADDPPQLADSPTDVAEPADRLHKKGDPGHRDPLTPETREQARRKMLVTNRLTRIERMMRDLGTELNELTRDMAEWREKARRYDELERRFREM